MYSILLVDDEENVRDRIRDFVPWNEYGFEITNEAGNGLEALDLIDEKMPDVIITDIKMPYLDGIELIKRIRSQYSSTVEIIILTGYDEFTYAQEAVKLKVAEYVLKPVSIESTKDLLKRIKARLDSDRAEFKNLSNETYSQMMESLRLQLLSSLITKRRLLSYNEKVFQEITGKLNINLDGKLFRVAIAESAKDEISSSFLINIATKAFEFMEEKPIFFMQDFQLIVIFKSKENNPNPFAIDVYNALKLLEESSIHYIEAPLKIGLGLAVNNLKDISSSYNEALEALNTALHMKDEQILAISDIQKKEGSSFKNLGSLKSDLIVSVKYGKEKDVNASVKAFFSKTTEMEEIERIVLFILSILGEIARDYSLKLNLISDGDLFNQLSHIRSLASAEKFCIRIASKINRLTSGQRENSRVEFVERAKDIIFTHYTDPLFGLEELCSIIEVSPPYFSSTFKKETGSSFVQFLTNTRLERAKELLRNSDAKNYEIAEKSGFSEPNYFSFTFKKNIGLSPSQYRAKVRNEKKAFKN